ncbi:MAG TPA: MFS transporter [Syntrophobacteraceae bacterium]|nr:MFS transporter [Syntrophobacteraceae bacterium]
MKIDIEVKVIFRAFRSRNYRLFFCGQGISLIGTWMQQAAMSWLVYRITGSTLLLGAVAFTNQIPTLFLGPFAGVIADRFERKRLLMWTQSLSMLQALILASLVLASAIQTWHIIALSLFIGSVNAFDIPIRQSFVLQIVERKEDLGNAIALNSAMFNSARFIGPLVAGILISMLGEGVCFLLNGISYLAVLAGLAAIRVAARQNHVGRAPVLRQFCEGIRYAFDFKPIIAILALLSLYSIAGAPYMVLMPAFARDVLHGGAHTYGFLMSAAGIGALSATMYLASRRNAHGLIKVIPTASVACSLGIASFALSRSFALSIICLLMAGFGMMTQIASSNTIIQTIVEEDKRGRIMSLYAMSFMGVMPFGSLLAGSIADRIGVQFTLLLGAACCITGASIFAMKLPMLCDRLKPVFADMEPCATQRVSHIDQTGSRRAWKKRRYLGS